MASWDTKLAVLAALFLALALVKWLAGGRPWDTPVRRRRRFGYRGTLGPLNEPEAAAKRDAPAPVQQEPAPPRDPEKEFFKED